MSSILCQKIIIGKSGDYIPALGVARLAMLATKKYKLSEVVYSMKSLRECLPSRVYSDQFEERYQSWKKIVNVNESISKKINK